jgi:ethanolamine ammonia-lyase small subunit
MNLNAKYVAIRGRSAVQYIWTETLQRLIAKAAQFQWNVCGHWVVSHSRVKVGDISEKLYTGVTHRGGQPVGHAQAHA